MKKILSIIAVLAIFVLPAAAQFTTVINAGDACYYAPTMGIDSAGNLYGCGTGTGRTWIGAANSTFNFTNKTFDTGATGNVLKVNGNTITATAGTATVTVPNSTTTLVGTGTTDTLSGKSFNQNIVPLNAGATDVGSTALPWLHLWLGTAATNNFEIIPAATAAARTVTINDPLANSTLRTEISGTATVDLASVASGACSADSSDVTVTGAAVGDAVIVTAGTALQAGSWLIGRVTASNTARFQFCNLSGGAIDRASDTYTIRDQK